jgi:phosphoribosylformylglycinamidine synthase
VASVRQGKRFEIELDGEIDREALDTIAATLLANTVIEDYSVRVEGA